MNNVVLIGRLTKDPELRYSQSNSQLAITRFTLAVDREYKKQGENQTADFIRIIVFGKSAENAEKYLSKGRQCAVRGHIQTGSYQDKEGRTVYTTDIVADRVEFIGGGSGQQQGGHQGGGSGYNQGYQDNNATSSYAGARGGYEENRPQQQQQQMDMDVGMPAQDGFSQVSDDFPF